METKKNKLLVGFSGGLTSAFMTKWIIENWQHKYEIVVVFANTGKERDETLQFVNDCDNKWNFNTVWIEAVVNPEKGKGTSFKIVTFETANRNGDVFEAVISKYGIPNVKFLHCTRELKTVPIHKYMKSLGHRNYYTAIGIRVDEVDRVNPNHLKLKFIYPLVSVIPTKKTDINQFWLSQSFTLNLKSYEGNCDLCYKKSDRKLLTLLKDDVSMADWWMEMEFKYSKYGEVYFYRQNRSIVDLVELAKKSFIEAKDESKDIERYKQIELFDDLDISNGCEESCEAF